ncbi:MAG: DEAD/DEAH box helicase [Candidatus Omnitrophica bacterium]|nr:DEAD/DEAH box helicase [Candidatus Omnitrophota bacterium]
MTTTNTPTTFFGLGIAPKVLEVLARMKFVVPTPIQHKAIPMAVEGKDIMGIAQTGTGKTLAFAIPMVQRLAQEPIGIGLVVVPTRELAIQVEETFNKVAQPFGLRTAILIGGASMEEQLRAIKKGARILIATPGRLIDHMQRGTVRLQTTRVLVLDEADRMFDMGFAPQIEQILQQVPKERQTMLFSATMPRDIMAMASRHMKLPINIEVAPQGTAAERVVQEIFVVRREMKSILLQKILGQYRGSILIFSRTKHGASKLVREIKAMTHSAAEIHSDRSLSQRRQALEGFKVGRYRILVATDIAARGIDVKGIELVINYDLPDDAENYVHRIGRTGRAGMEGRAISIATPDQADQIQAIERCMRSEIKLAEHPEIETQKLYRAPSRSASSGSSSRRPSSGGRSFRGKSFGGRRRF